MGNDDARRAGVQQPGNLVVRTIRNPTRKSLTKEARDHSATLPSPAVWIVLIKFVISRIDMGVCSQSRKTQSAPDIAIILLIRSCLLVLYHDCKPSILITGLSVIEQSTHFALPGSPKSAPTKKTALPVLIRSLSLNGCANDRFL